MWRACGMLYMKNGFHLIKNKNVGPIVRLEKILKLF